MKHIKKRFRFEQALTEEVKSNLERTSTLHDKNSVKNVPKNHKVLMVSERPDGNKLIEAFHFNKNGKHYFIPEPDPVLIYFHIAYINYKAINEREKAMLKKLDEQTISESVSNEIYSHFAVCMGFVTSLFIAIEAFINSLIPDDYLFRDEKSNKTEIYNKDQIQKHLSFDLKYSKILKEITGKDFSKDKPLKWQHIVNLKDFRDMIVHTKMKSDGLTPYDYLFKKSLQFKYDESLENTREFINFYKPDYIVECDCGMDF